MEDSLTETDKGIVNDCVNASVYALGDLLREHNGQDISILDLRGINNWTDYFIIATATSQTHIDGMERHLKDYCRENKIDILGCSRKSTDDEWRLIDLGFAIIHLMNKRVREFYDLERLWRLPGHS